MAMIQNNQITIVAEADGRGLKILDRKRGTAWVLDEKSTVWGKRVSKNEWIIKDELKTLKSLEPFRSEAKGNQLILTYKTDTCEVVYIYSLLEDGVEVTLLPPADTSIETLAMPGAFVPEESSMKIILPIMQGMLWDGRGENMDHTTRMGNHSFSMQMYGLLQDKSALLSANVTTVDGFWRYQKDDYGFRVQNIQESTLGSMNYERVIRFYITDSSIQAVAKRYREHVKQTGRFLSWDEKLQSRPHLERLFGSLMSYIGYCHDDLDYVEEFKKLSKYGFRGVLAYPVFFSSYDEDFQMGGYPPIRISNEDIEKIKAMGVDVCPWSWINEAIDTQNDRRSNMYRISRDKQRVFGWQIDDYKWYKVCSPEMYNFESVAVNEGCADMTWDHFDVLTCATIGECYAEDHKSHIGKPLSRNEDMEWIKKTLLAARADKTRVAVSSECFNDLFSTEYDMGSCKALPQYGPWVFWPIPLTSLVYHDSMMHTWYEMHSYNATQFGRAVGPNLFEYGGGRPDSQSAWDALTGSPPDVFPFGAQYGWTGRKTETYAYRFRFEDPSVQYALEKALPVAKLHEKIGKLEMVDFEILSHDGWVQRSAFSDGTEIVVNFGVNLRNDIKGIPPLLGYQWMIL